MPWAHLVGETSEYICEYRTLQADGTYRWVLDRGACLRDGDGNAYRMAGSLGDITDRKQGELFLRSVVDTLPAALNIRDTEGRYVMINEHLAGYYGIDPRDTTGKLPEQAFPQAPTDEREEDEFQEVLKTGCAVVDSEYRYQTEDGGEEFWLTTRQPIRGDAGELQYVLSVSFDITERKRAERELAEKEAQFRLAMDNMPGGIRLADKDRRYVFFNSQYSELYDFPEGLLEVGESTRVENLYAAKRGDFGPGDPEALTDEWMGVHPVYSEPTSWQERTIPGGKILQVSTSPTPDGGVVNIVTDITERTRAEEDIAAKETQLRIVLDNMPDGVRCFDKDNRYVFSIRAIAIYGICPTASSRSVTILVSRILTWRSEETMATVTWRRWSKQ